MKCFCDAEVSASARFCPHCGTSLTHELAQSASAAISWPTTTDLSVSNGSRKEGRQLLTEAATLKEADWAPPLPPKYRAALQLGTAPQIVMWEMFKRIIELRNLLEETVDGWPAHLDNNQISRARAFLRSHCASCGNPTPHALDGKAAICANCENM